MNLLDQPLDLVQATAQILDRPTVLTEEQLAICSHELRPGEAAKVIAYAGTGKTSTFVAYARQRPNVQMTYLAFNKSVETEAKERFGPNVLPKTVHAMAYSIVGKRYKQIVGSVPNWVIAKALRTPIYEATLVSKTLETYLNSADTELDEKHVEPDHLHRLSATYHSGVLDAARSVWSAVQAQSHDFLMTHSGYLKLYQLSKPTLPGSIILLDEAQDTNPVTQDIVVSQLQKGKSVLLCGDPYQQIYAWRGAEDAMEQLDCTTFRLSQSWRFEQHIADIANTILKSFFNEQVPLKGLPNALVESTKEITGTTITRTNSEIFRQAIPFATKEQPFHVIGREAFMQLLDSVLDVYNLFSGKRSAVMDRKISRFHHFNDLKEYAESTLDIEVLGRCHLVETYQDNIPDYVRRMRECYTASQTDVPIFVTCHKAKGLEWNHVHISEDFEDLYDEDGKLRKLGKGDDALTKDEVNLLYVAVTRAKKTLSLNYNLTRLCQSF